MNEDSASQNEAPSTSIKIVNSNSGISSAGVGGGSMNDSYAARVQVIEKDGLENAVSKIEEKRHSKHTTQTTTTTTSTSKAQPVLLAPGELTAPTTPVNFAADAGICHSSHLAYVQQPVPVYAVTAAPYVPIPIQTRLSFLPQPQPVTHYTTSSGTFFLLNNSNK